MPSQTNIPIFKRNNSEFYANKDMPQSIYLHPKIPPFIFIRNNSRFYFIQHYAESSTGYQRLTKSLTLQQFGWHFELRPL